MLRELFEALLRERRNPSPFIAVTTAPDGRTGLIALQKGDTYELQKLPPAKVRVPQHSYRMAPDLVVYLQHHHSAAAKTAALLVLGNQVVVDLDDGSPTAGLLTCVHPWDRQYEGLLELGTWRSPASMVRALRGLGAVSIELDPGTPQEPPVQVDLVELLIPQLLVTTVSSDSKVEQRVNRHGMLEFVVVGRAQGASVKLPEEFNWYGPTLLGIGTSFRQRYLVETAIDEGALKLRIVPADPEHLRQETSWHLVEYLRDELGEGWCVGVGTRDTADRSPLA